MTPQDAEEYTQALGQVVAGGWRQIALGKRLGVPKALNLTVDEWVKKRLGGYVRMNLDERREAEVDLRSQGFSNRAIADVIGVSHTQVNEDFGGKNLPLDDDDASNNSDDDGKNLPVDTVAGLAATDAVRKQIDADERRVARDEERAARRRAAAAAAQAAPIADVDATIQLGSFTTVADQLEDESVSLIFTDPPYDDEFLPTYRDIGIVAERVLKPGGSLITYVGQHRLLEVGAMLQASGLTFFWPLSVNYSSGSYARMEGFGVIVHGKPLLWFVKGTMRLREDWQFVHDAIDSPRPEKTHHPWQQEIASARYYIETLTQPGDLVFDPLCGGGTTATASALVGRRWLTCDIDQESVWIARQRLRETVAAVRHG